MAKTLKAVRYRSLDEARRALEDGLGAQVPRDIFDDGGEEPQGLLSVIPEDRLTDENFHKLFALGKGVLVEVERIEFSGYGPPAEEEDYMGFATEGIAYVLQGRTLPVGIEGCSFGASDIHHLDAMILDGEHPIDRSHLAEKLGLGSDWDFDLLFEKLRSGELTAQEIDEAIHEGIH